MNPVRDRRVWGLAALLLIVGAVVLVANSPRFQWRATLIDLKVDGPLQSLDWAHVLQAAAPDFTGVSGEARIARQAATEAYGSIDNPRTSESDLEAGRRIYEDNCATCHGDQGEGAVGPSLADGVYTHGASDWAIYRNIVAGVGGMDGFDLPWDSAWQVAAHVRRLSTSTQVGRSAPKAPAPELGRARLEAGELADGNWLTYSGDYTGTRFSPLDQISVDNVAGLQVEWVYQMETAERRVEATPLVVDGIMYVSEPPARVHALDARTGRKLWSYSHTVPEDVPGAYGLVNRGVAVLDNTVYLGTLDAHLVAIDATGGEIRWEAQIADHRDGYTVTGAPLAVGDLVITGVSGGMHGIRGFLDAYDAETGERVWRFHAVPGPGEKGHDTWEGESWKTGGGGTWVTGSFDPDLGLIYWGIGNPAPPYDGRDREGDNLFTNSVVALDAESGELVWHFQFTPHDLHDWDSAQVPVLVDGRSRDGEPEKLLLWANRNGFFYVLDRETGEFLNAEEFGRITWADSIDSSGRPVVRENVEPTEVGTLAYPGFLGATNWWSPTYSEDAGLFYVPVWERGNIFYRRDAEYRQGQRFQGGYAASIPGEVSRNHIVALDPGTGNTVWQRELDGESWGGTLSTAGGLVFAASDRSLKAFRAGDGRRMWEFNAGGLANAGPMTYVVGGEQRIAVAFGRSLFSFGLPEQP
jgi:alcohol dehydrogenase (cytochrome c)